MFHVITFNDCADTFWLATTNAANAKKMDLIVGCSRNVILLCLHRITEIVPIIGEISELLTVEVAKLVSGNSATTYLKRAMRSASLLVAIVCGSRRSVPKR